MNNRLLSSLGLNQKEIDVYNAVLKEKSLTSSNIAKRTKIKRTTAYNVARALVEKGLLVENSTARPVVFTTASTTEMLGVIEEEKKRLNSKEQVTKELAEELAQKAAETSYPVPKIRFIEEDKIESFLRQETPKWHRALENLVEPVWWGFQDHTFISKCGSWVDWQWKNAPESIQVQLLTNESKVEKKVAGKYPKRSMKFWDGGDRFNSTTWVVEEYVVIVNTKRRPFYLYEIHDELLSNDLRELFKNIWTAKSN